MSVENKAITLQQAKTLYDDLRQRQENIPSAENIVMVQDQQPTIPANKVWLTETPPVGVDVPTYEEFTGVIAPDYADLDFPVSAGEHCIHNGVLYTAVQNINASEAWTAAHWEAGSVSSKLTEISNAIQGLDNDKYEKPSGGIPSTDMTQAVQDALADAESAYQKPSGGIPATDIADGVIPVVDNALSDSSENAVQNKVVKGALDTKAPVIINTVTGNPAVFNDGYGLPLKSLLIPFTPKQEGTGDPSPTNIRPLLPWDGLTVGQGGKNLLNPAKYRFGTTTSQGLTFVVQSDGSVKVTGTTEASDFGPPLSARFQLPAGTYYGFKDEGNVYVTYRKSTEEEGGTTSPLISPFTLDGTEWVYCNIYVRNSGTFDITIHPQIARENAQSSYEPYKPITETDISFPSPVYGGEHEAVSGKLMDAFKSVDLGSKSWKLRSENQQRQVWECVCNDAKFGIEGNTYIANALSSQFSLTTSSASWSVGKFAPALSSNDKVFIFYVPAGSYANATECKEGMDGIQLCYELIDSAKQEITLTPEQITALVGDNTIWSDANGQMIVEYPADTETFIANQHRNFIAPELSSMKADTALVKNDFRIVGNNLYKITTAIASGGTLTPNTNCVKTTLAEVIKPLLT